MPSPNKAHGFLRSRADQLADYLRDEIGRGELAEPLPGIREWSSRLGVGRGTLEEAVRLLHREGVLDVQPRRGIRLGRAREAAAAATRPRVVRWLFHGRDYPDTSVLMEIMAALVERLRVHNLNLRIEQCDAARLRAIHTKGEDPHEMLVLASLPEGHQRRFEDFRHSALVVGTPFPGVSLPWVSNDFEGATRHAVSLLARRGFKRVSLVARQHSHGLTDFYFQRLCAKAGQFIRGEVVLVPMGLVEQAASVKRYASRITPGHAIISLYPVPATLIISALLYRGFSVPREVEVIAMNTTTMAVRVVPTPIFYPFPVEAFAKTVARAAITYFERGTLPRLRKLIPLEVVRPQ